MSNRLITDVGWIVTNSEDQIIMCDRTKVEIIARQLAYSYKNGQFDINCNMSSSEMTKYSNENWEQFIITAKNLLKLIETHPE